MKSYLIVVGRYSDLWPAVDADLPSYGKGSWRTSFEGCEL